MEFDTHLSYILLFSSSPFGNLQSPCVWIWSCTLLKHFILHTFIQTNLIWCINFKKALNNQRFSNKSLKRPWKSICIFLSSLPCSYNFIFNLGCRKKGKPAIPKEMNKKSTDHHKTSKGLLETSVSVCLSVGEKKSGSLEAQRSKE